MAAKKKRTFESGMQELGALVEKLSESELPLEEAIALYEQGMKLHGELEAQLAQQKKKIEMIDPETGEIESFEENESDV